MNAAIARRYARALLEVATEQQQVEPIAEELGRLVAAYEGSPELANLLTNPVFNVAQRHAAFEGLAGYLELSPLLRNTVKLLIDRHRAAAIPQIGRIYRELSDERAGRARAQVWSAVPLPPELVANLASALSAAMHREVLLQPAQDANLIGGVVTQVGSFVFDGSVRGRLRELRRELKKP